VACSVGRTGPIGYLVIELLDFSRLNIVDLPLSENSGYLGQHPFPGVRLKILPMQLHIFVRYLLERRVIGGTFGKELALAFFC
jgi:hypothetical protein